MKEEPEITETETETEKMLIKKIAGDLVNAFVCSRNLNLKSEKLESGKKLFITYASFLMFYEIALLSFLEYIPHEERKDFTFESCKNMNKLHDKIIERIDMEEFEKSGGVW